MVEVVRAAHEEQLKETEEHHRPEGVNERQAPRRHLCARSISKWMLPDESMEMEAATNRIGQERIGKRRIILRQEAIVGLEHELGE